MNKLKEAIYMGNCGMLDDNLEQCAGKYNIKDAIAVFRTSYGHSEFSAKDVRECIREIKETGFMA